MGRACLAVGGAARGPGHLTGCLLLPFALKPCLVSRAFRDWCARSRAFCARSLHRLSPACPPHFPLATPCLPGCSLGETLLPGSHRHQDWMPRYVGFSPPLAHSLRCWGVVSSALPLRPPGARRRWFSPPRRSAGASSALSCLRSWRPHSRPFPPHSMALLKGFSLHLPGTGLHSGHDCLPPGVATLPSALSAAF